MKEVAAGTHAKDIAKDLNISTSSVYRCKRHAKAAAKATTKSLPQAKFGTGVPAAPAMAACLWRIVDSGRNHFRNAVL
jgi:hypothetical protein